MPKFIENLPVAEDFMETARSFGNYDLALALADLIDNSITAHAKNIVIEASFQKNEIRISDDGCGMSKEALITAMRLGSRNPNETRDENDLGRFGLGLKTASFSQADELFVFTNQNGNFSGAHWNLKDCVDFKMGVYDNEETLALAESSIKTHDGTEVVWKNLSRLTTGSSNTEIESDYNDAVTSAIHELGLIFHRYLDDENLKEKISIEFNGNRIKPVDPYFRSNRAHQELREFSESIGEEKVVLRGFILPHHSKLSGKELSQLGGKEGVVKNSGFYIYRKRRLIIKGTWFKLIPHGELFKLARVMVDIPNSLDEQWKITVDKSGAQLPGALRKRLLGWIEKSVVIRSREIFRHRASQEISGKAYPVWFAKRRADRQEFSIDVSHPIIKDYLKGLGSVEKAEFKKVIGVIEKCLPINAIHSAISDNPEVVIQGYVEASNEMKEWAKELALKSLREGKKKKSEIIESIALMQPFSSFPTEIKEFLETEGIFEG